MEPTTDQLIELYRRMVRIREFDERAGLLLERAEVPGAAEIVARIEQLTTATGA
jgi:TPP-dependent pyruvate/acetoin dehydrogenase alpha subunit